MVAVTCKQKDITITSVLRNNGSLSLIFSDKGQRRSLFKLIFVLNGVQSIEIHLSRMRLCPIHFIPLINLPMHHLPSSHRLSCYIYSWGKRTAWKFCSLAFWLHYHVIAYCGSDWQYFLHYQYGTS